MKSRIKKIVVIGIFLLIGNISQLFARTVTLSWNPNREADLAGYIVFLGQTSREYDTLYFVSKGVNEFQLNIVNDTLDYYVALKAVDNSGNRSDYSSEVIVMGDAAGLQQNEEDLLLSGNLSYSERGNAKLSSSSGLVSIFGKYYHPCSPDNLDACSQAECARLGCGYWWYGSCHHGQQQESYEGRIVEAPVRLGDNANDGQLSVGDGLSFEIDVPTGVKTYVLVVFPHNDYYFIDNIDNNIRFTKQLVSTISGQFPVTDNLCRFLRQYPGLKTLEGRWKIAFLTIPVIVGEFQNLNELSDYVNSGGVYHYGSYNVVVDCQN